MIELFIGFHAPHFRNRHGRIDPRGWLGHCEVWGYTKDDTWLFLDPAGSGTKILVTHLHDEVQDHLAARFALCETIMRLPANAADFSFPLHGMLTCASFCGHLVGVRALVPASLRRKLRAKGAEVIHETQGRSR